MSPHHHSHPKLTKNQSLVMNTLSHAEGPLSAYTILDNLRDEGFRAPLQVYRALDKLVEYGLIHKLESMNAFVACQHKDCSQHQMVAFTICQECSDVSELSNQELTILLTEITDQAGFSLKQSMVELRGTCQNCQGKTN